MSKQEQQFVTSDRKGNGVFVGDYITLEHYGITHIAKLSESGNGITKCGKEIWICDVVEINDSISKCKRCFPITKLLNGDQE